MKIFIIAGETSGDQLGASIIQALRAAYAPAQIELRGIGGDNLREVGLTQSLFPMSDLSIMGIAEILPKIPQILKRIDQTVTAITLYNPDLIITIDAPDFCFRVLKKLQNKKLKSKKIHVVAPSVWAWREGRAQKIAKLLDGLLCLLPFEPPYFEKEGLHTAFMGHPIVNSSIAHANGNAFRFRHVISMEQPTCGIFFGSRTSELKYHTDIFLDIAQKIQEQIPDIIFIAPTLPKFKDQIVQEFRTRGLKAIVTSDRAEKDEAIAACNIALNVSGTIGLELSIANVPHVMAYKFQKLSYFIAKMMVKTKYGHLTNIIMDEEIIPEFLQDDVDADIIANRLINLLNTQHIRQKQIQAFQIVKDRLTPDNAQKNSANKAAEFILSFLN
jgi:lipid-A-disaccharide synthase